MLVLVLTVVLGVVVVVVVGVVVVVVGAVVVVVVVDGSVVVVEVPVSPAVSVTVAGGAPAGADVVVTGVSEEVVVSDGESPVMALANPNTTRAIRTAPIAPSDTSPTGLRYQGVAASASGGGGWS